jgi:hypothetical protein
MGDILRQRFRYAEITMYKDYCSLGEKKSFNGTTFNDDLDSLDDFELGGSSWESIYKPKVGRIITLPTRRDKRKTCYFYQNSEIEEKIQLNYAYLNKDRNNTFETTENRHIINHYGRAFSDIRISTFERSIRRNGDKITLKVYRHIKHRNFNSIYFKSHSNVMSITVNTVTGNFTILSYDKSAKNPRKSFRCNSFTLLDILTGSSGMFQMREYVGKKSKVYGDFKEIFNDEEFLKLAVQSLDLKNPNEIVRDDYDFKQKFIEQFIDKKKIKVSDNYQFWIKYFYPTEKYLKKNGRKLILSILDYLQIKSKITNKIIHEHPDTDIVSLSRVCYFLGDNFSKYVGTIDRKIFETSTLSNSLVQGGNLKIHITQQKNHGYTIKDVEKENMIKIINDLVTETTMSRGNGIFSRTISDIYDHFNMIHRLREYIPELHLKSKTYKEFHSEHLELSKMMSMIKKGWVIEYKFADEMVNEIEEPIKSYNSVDFGKGVTGSDMNDYVTIYPHILKREEEYDEEGSFMHHCVASYSNKDLSIIISLRTEDLSDRVTCEFDCATGVLIQAKHFCNKQPSDSMLRVIERLKPKVTKFAKMGILKSIEKKRVPFMVNGIEVIKKEEPEFLFG